MTKHLPDEAARGFPAGTLIDHRYRVVRLIHQGSAGLLYEVEHVRTGRRLALKTLRDRDDPARMEDEARATGLLKNTHAVKITDMATGANVGTYLVMDLIEGRSLRALLDEKKQLPVATAVNIALQICECLAEAHEHGLVHGDLKPESILLAPSPLPDHHDVKVIDFGAAKRSPRADTAGECVYASPEQLQDAPDVDGRTDVYALGVMFYECLAGRKPYEAATTDAVIRAISAGPPVQLGRARPDAPADLCQAAMRALSVHREQRQPSLRDVAAVMLPYGDASLGAWLRGGVEERRPPVVVGPAAAPELTVRTRIEPGAGSDRGAGRPNEPPPRDAGRTAPDPPWPDSDPITTSWSVEPPASARLAGNAALPASSWSPETRASSGEKIAPAESRPDSERPTSAWNNSTVRSLGGIDGIGQPDGPPSEPLGLFGAQPPASRRVDDDAAFEATVLAPLQAQPRLGSIAPEPGRDTPTEMYRKSDQWPLPTETDASAQLDRNTPTSVSRLPRFGPPPFAGGFMQPDGGEERGQLPAGETRVTALQNAMATSVLNPRPSASHPLAPPGFPSVVPGAGKPGWQRSLDRTLVWVGDGIEHRVDQLRRASTASRIALLLLGIALLVLLVGGALYLGSG